MNSKNDKRIYVKPNRYILMLTGKDRQEKKEQRSVFSFTSQHPLGQPVNA